MRASSACPWKRHEPASRFHALLGIGLAAGAMIYIVSHEVIPETQRNGHQTSTTIGLMAGFAVMLVLDTTLG